ncbi:bb2db053-a4b7-4079-bb7a-dfcdab050b9b [Thermothielavioides terrestris]|uniref:Bb2db053-a4b7-4079-bb7a-dfcdab050b9b n=1 Tax=Thermothielavioides terrestris TaxID=2587410 RepID=A0A3S4ETB6_9PEZI|nr:bb2db053-a4b7-4079-bb7a-dfcdab050b9b [Thermothielavioides terrestris]
MPLGLKGVDKS